MNDMIGELTREEVTKEVDGVTKLIPAEFTCHASPDTVKVIIEELKLNLKKVYPDKKIIVKESEEE